MKRALLLLAVSCAASGPAPVAVSVGGWRATYRDWSGVDVCATEPSWLLDELGEVNDLLERFTARGGTWRDDELPLFEQAVRELGPMIDVHGRTLAALSACPYAREGTWVRVLHAGGKLVTAARAEVEGAPQLISFVRHQQSVERWRKALEPKRETARERCAADAGLDPVIYFAYGDELAGTTWLFCDGAVVNAPLIGSLELKQTPEAWPAAKLAELRARCFELARAHPNGLIEQPPR